MPDLRQASFLESLFSFFSPKRLEVQVRTAVLKNGDFGVKPLFFIDGREVPADEISPDSNQKVLGRYVRLDQRTKKVLDLTKGRPIRLAKSKAADLLDDLSKTGVPIRGRDSACRSRPTICSALRRFFIREPFQARAGARGFSHKTLLKIWGGRQRAPPAPASLEASLALPWLRPPRILAPGVALYKAGQVNSFSPDSHDCQAIRQPSGGLRSVFDDEKAIFQGSARPIKKRLGRGVRQV
jgi:hypothetical protein